MLKRLLNYASVGLAICATSCALLNPTRVLVLDSRSDVVRLGPGVKGKVYVWRNAQWELQGPMMLPEGWYAGPMPDGPDP